MTTGAGKASHHAVCTACAYLARLHYLRINCRIAFIIGDLLAHDLRDLREVIKAACGQSATGTRHVNFQRHVADRQRVAYPSLLGKGVIGVGDVD